MKNKGGRPKGSKTQPSLIKFERRKTLALSRDCQRIVNDRANGSGLSPTMVLEDLIMAGDYTMGPVYDNVTNFRSRIRKKLEERKNVTPVTSTEEAGTNGTNGAIEGSEALGSAARNEHVPEGPAEVPAGSGDADEQLGHRPEDNPAFRDPGAIGNVIGTGAALPVAEYDTSDYGPVLTDEEGNPLQPREPEEAYPE